MRYYRALVTVVVLVAMQNTASAQTISLHCGDNVNAFTLNIDYSTNQVSFVHDLKGLPDYTMAAQVSDGSVSWTYSPDPEQPATYVLNRYSGILYESAPPVPGKYTGSTWSAPCTTPARKF